MADTVVITANVVSGVTSNPNVVDGSVVQTNVADGVAVTGQVVAGARGEQGIQGEPGLSGTIVAVSTTAPPSPSVGDLWVDIS